MAGNPKNPGRPGPGGMSQGTYTGNVSFSRGNTDLISKGANLPSMKAPAPAPTPKPVAPTPSRPSFGISVAPGHDTYSSYGV